MVLKANDMRISCPCHDEFRGPRSDYVRQAMASHTITPAVGAMCRCKAKEGLRNSPRGLTIVIAAEIESGFVAKDDLVPFRCSPVSSYTAPLQTEVSMRRRQGQHK
ncbi:uncharacterized protein TNCV_1370451 [Trichonephila clavipes]|nr:uncharacterized protein TNCV_1370451 [Trichonephila clavipes]